MNNFNIIILFFFMGTFFCKSQKVHAQNKFKASAVFGLTAAQLGGDSISGYDKLGLTFGGKLTYALSSKLDINFELLYSQRGSSDSFSFSSSGSNVTQLNYIEIPIYLTLNDWLIEKENYHKVGLFGGLSYAYLISADSSNPILSGRENEFNSSDISARVGVYYSFTKSLTFRTYYSDSFVKLLEGGLFNTEGLDSFYWTFRLEYNL